MSTKEPSEMSYEEAMKELEGLVKKLENGDLDLALSLAIFERAAVLKNRCQAILDESERRVQTIIEEKGEICLKDFD